MNNLRLLTGLLSATLLSAGVCAYSQSRVISLEEIFVSAETNSRQLRSYLTAQAEAESAVSVVRADRLPEINASVSASYLGNGFTTKRDFTDYQPAPIPHFGSGAAINITQPIYTGGSITISIKIAEQKSMAARYATDFQRDNIRFRLVGLYLDLYKCGNLRRVVESNIAAARKVLDDMRARYSQGTALQNDITRYELMLSNLELQLVKLNNTGKIINTDIITTAGLPDGILIERDTTILDRALPRETEEWWQSEAKRNSPTLKLAESSVAISRKTESLIRSERLPKIGVQAGWSLDGPILVEVPPINRNLSYWYAGIGISYNISSLYKSNKSLKKSRLTTQKAIDDYEVAQEGVSLAVNAVHVRYLEAYEELKTQAKSVELAARNYHTTSTRYSNDMALITDMLDAASAKLDAEQQLVNARINIIYYYYKLLFTTGKI